MAYNKQAAKISWNGKALAGISKRDFVAKFSTVYPAADLEKEFDELFPKKAPSNPDKKQIGTDSTPEK